MRQGERYRCLGPSALSAPDAGQGHALTLGSVDAAAIRQPFEEDEEEEEEAEADPTMSPSGSAASESSGQTALLVRPGQEVPKHLRR